MLIAKISAGQRFEILGYRLKNHLQWKKLLAVTSAPLLCSSCFFPAKFHLTTTFTREINSHSVSNCYLVLHRQRSDPSIKPSLFSTKMKHNDDDHGDDLNEISSNKSLRNIYDYLDDIEENLNPLFLSNGDKVVCTDDGIPCVWVKVRMPNRKPMIRNLLGMHKVQMNQVIRDTKNNLEYLRLKSYMDLYFLPHLRSTSKDAQIIEFFQTELNSIYKQYDSNSKPNSRSMFRRLATGPQYRGDLQCLVNDVAAHTLPQFMEANQELNEMEIIKVIIENKLSIHNSDNDDSNDYDASLEQRYHAALKCLKLFENSNPKDYNNDDETDEGKVRSTSVSNKVSGRECEKACISFLRKENMTLKKRRIVLSNVYINKTSTSSKPKYHQNSQRFDIKSNNNNDENYFTSAIIWTKNERDKICSELDAIVIEVDENYNSETSSNNVLIQGRIIEFWEAKSSLSPSALYDAVTKKLNAIQSILLDQDSILTFGPYRMKIHLNQNNTIFGVFAMELLPPLNAVGQLKSMAMAKALDDRNNFDLIVQAINTGYVSIPINEIQSDVKSLRENLSHIPDKFQFKMKIANDFDAEMILPD